MKAKLGLTELTAIALGGMVGGGIFAILGIAVSLIGNLTPISIIIGGIIALLAAYSYVKLGVYYKDEGATYAFYKKTYPDSHLLAAIIGWFVIFGYISTLALYAYTFSAYAISSTSFADNLWARKGIAIGILSLFTLINIWSVNGMGKLEDLMVYTKLVILGLISFVLIQYGETDFSTFMGNIAIDVKQSSFLSVLIVSSMTFVAYEGFQLVINAVNEMTNPDKNIPRAIYTAIVLAILIYVIISLGALLAIPIQEIIDNQEYALAAGAGKVFGKIGTNLVILGAILATSSAINGTVFGASRQLSAIAADGYFPNIFSKKINNIPVNAIILMTVMAGGLILVGGLALILEFGSITFLLVSLLMALANHKIRKETQSSNLITLLAIAGLAVSGVLILYYEFTTEWEAMASILVLYFLLTLGAVAFSRKKQRTIDNPTN